MTEDYFNISDTRYSLDDLTDQNIELNTDVQTYVLPNPASKPFKEYPAGSSLGVMDSYIINQFGTWLMFYDNSTGDGIPYYYLVKPGEVNTAVLQNEGLKTIKQQTDEQAQKNMDFWDKLKNELLSASKIFLIGLGIFILLFIIYQIYVTSKKS